ncbi:hypothetical protein N5079_04945 [Planotetraspora sp. A-T 1434]|uniref:hypothetical protein n=1 Tax=Planotetraspora sp. A-T 1434 TaxID=2979219 RepID=UPI0021C0FE7D|nr:hypothetical protein [Planotetraspora sp. A-T 1434]MCT9929564.1 hypothetical protein [Planotetraspora sp. A-T 1434]
MLRKLVVRAVVLFALFYLFTHPASAAGLVNQAVRAAHAAADDLAGFLSILN